MEAQRESVYNLITALCEHFFTSTDKVKTTRSKCYELLLKKKIGIDPRKFKDVKGINEPMINLLAWCYRLTHEYDCKESSQQLQAAVDKLEEEYHGDSNSFDSVLTFLLCLKDIPKKVNDKLDLSVLPEIDDKLMYLNNLFKLPPSLIGESSNPSTDMFKINPEPPTSMNTQKSLDILNQKKQDMWKDEGYSSPDKDNIWEMASQMNFSNTHSWESYGCGPPDKEKPFLSELGELSSLWVENLESLYLANNLFPSFTIIHNKVKPRKIFIRDLKYLLVGMPSETFNLSSMEEFFLSPGIMVEDITPDALERYCSDFLLAGTCYRALNQMTTTDPNTRSYKYPGYVFAEFCVSLSRYLQFYRTAVISLSEDINYLMIHEKTNRIQMQVLTLASICKVGPYASETEQIPHGVALLNYLYQKLLGLSDKNLCMVLYSILYPCCQIYFSRFLHQWLIKGILNDPHGEFFITSSLKYLSTRGRTYWTKSYRIQEDIIPDFLMDLKDDILSCGRIMNLLQLCNPTNKLCVYLTGKCPLALTCCLTPEKLTQLEHNASKYYLDACTECGSRFSFTKLLQKSRESDVVYLQLIAKKRAATLRRIELERQKIAQEQREKKLEELLMLKEQYETALEQKQLSVYREIEKEIKTLRENLFVEEMRDKLIQEESLKMIHYYTELYQIAEKRKEQIENHIKCANSVHLDTMLNGKNTVNSSENVALEKVNSSSDSFYSAPEETEMTEMPEEKCVMMDKQFNMHSSESMDVLNANIETKESNAETNTTINLQSSADNIYQVQQSTNIQQAIDNFELARKIKQKVLNQELGIIGDIIPKAPISIKDITTVSNLTDAQRNKLKILSSEFGIEVIRDQVKTDGVLTVAQVNRNKMLRHNDCFSMNYDKMLDNESFMNRNVKNVAGNNIALENNESKSTTMKKSRSLQLDFDKLSVKSDSDKPVPMSVDSTPMSDFPQTVTPLSDFPRSVTPSSMFMSTETKFDSFPTTADTHHTEDIFNFNTASQSIGTSLNYYQKVPESQSVPAFSKRVTVKEAKGISKNSLKLLLHESVSIPLLTQLKLGNNEILKYFVEELHYFKHLGSLRDYFFLQDGEFGRNITENLFKKLYSANFPLELINFKTLQDLVFSALDNSSKFQENSGHLSFGINSLPKCFDLGDPNVLDCLTLHYKVNWPLNILLPSDTISKYDQIFKYLIKLNRVSWVLKNIFLDLKLLAKETGKKAIYLMSSPQYRRLHQCRHVMSHFMQTLQNYIVGEVLQPSWDVFEMSLSNVTNLDELYHAHAGYIKDIIFKCMLHQKFTALQTNIHKIFVVILKFYDYLRSRRWKCEDGFYVHPNFAKLDKIFQNFEEFVIYFFRMVKKVARSGYQPHLIQFLDVLNVNDYYSKKIVQNAH